VIERRGALLKALIIVYFSALIVGGISRRARRGFSFSHASTRITFTDDAAVSFVLGIGTEKVHSN